MRSENVDGHFSNAASTRQLTCPGGSERVSSVSVVTPMICGSEPSMETKTRYFAASSTALQTKVMGEVVVSPFPGEMAFGFSVGQRAVVSPMWNKALPDGTGGMAAKN